MGEEILRNIWRGVLISASSHKVARKGCNAHHTLGLQVPDENSANTLPHILMVVGADAADTGGKRVPWVASQTDSLANDWFVAE